MFREGQMQRVLPPFSGLITIATSVYVRVVPFLDIAKSFLPCSPSEGLIVIGQRIADAVIRDRLAIICGQQIAPGGIWDRLVAIGPFLRPHPSSDKQYVCRRLRIV